MSKVQADRDRQTWLWFEFMLPMFTLVWLWPMMAYLGQRPYAFQAVFGGADLVPVAALLMLNVWREIDRHARAGGVMTPMLENFQYAAVLVPVGILTLYGFVKYFVMLHPVPSALDEPPDERLLAIGFASLAVLVFAGGFGWAARKLLARDADEPVS